MSIVKPEAPLQKRVDVGSMREMEADVQKEVAEIESCSYCRSPLSRRISNVATKPFATWLSCEETDFPASNGVRRGWVFDVPPWIRSQRNRSKAWDAFRMKPLRSARERASSTSRRWEQCRPLSVYA
jgi:hypothetical protein